LPKLLLLLNLITFCRKGRKGQLRPKRPFKGCLGLPLGHPDYFLFYASKL